jgi:hypothetical protein
MLTGLFTPAYAEVTIMMENSQGIRLAIESTPAEIFSASANFRMMLPAGGSIPYLKVMLAIPADAQPEVILEREQHEPALDRVHARVGNDIVDKNLTKHILPLPAAAEPWQRYHLSQTGIIRGQRIVNLDIFPFRYDRAHDSIEISRKMEIFINFHNKISEKCQRHSDVFDGMLKKMVLNPAAVCRAEPKQPPAPISTLTMSGALTDSLKNSSRGADYIIIAYRDFIKSLLPLQAFHEQQGRRVSLIDVQSIYDEFNDGVPHPQAIKDFLSYAYHFWTQPAPAYVLLVGDAAYNESNSQDNGNYIPSVRTSTRYSGLAANENFYVTVDGDDEYPDMLLGRFAVRTAAEVDAVVAKTLAYEQAARDKTARPAALFVADDDYPLFESVAENFIGYFPSNYPIDRLYLADYSSDQTAHDDLQIRFNQGPALITYFGHGSKTSWTDEVIFEKSDVANLANQQYPIVAAFDCLNGSFDQPQLARCLAEEVVNAPASGGVAYIASTAAGISYDFQQIGNLFFHFIFEARAESLGAALTMAKILAVDSYYVDEENLRIVTLFGDPALGLTILNTGLPGSDQENDADGDQIRNDVDNCPGLANTDQRDSDDDGQGDVCDPCPLDAGDDSDLDGVCDGQDNCPETSNADQKDSNGNGLGDMCDMTYPCGIIPANRVGGGHGVGGRFLLVSLFLAAAGQALLRKHIVL